MRRYSLIVGMRGSEAARERIRAAFVAASIESSLENKLLLADPFNKNTYALLDEKLSGSPESAAIKDYFSPGFVTQAGTSE